MKQLTLNFQCNPTKTLDNFYWSMANGALQDVLCQALQNSLKTHLYCWGENQIGKTHLLQGFCQEASARGLDVMYLPLSSFKQLSTELLESMEDFTWIGLDDVDAVMGDLAWETALFHLYNRMELTQTRLILTGSIASQQLPCVLPDLKSRLNSCLVFNLHGLSDVEKTAFLRAKAKENGFEIPMEVATFILTHYPRSMPNLLTILKMLETASLSEQRRLTVPFVKKILGKGAFL